MASSFKSNHSASVAEQEQEQTKDLNLIDHVTGLAASLGGLFSSPKNADEKASEEKSVSVSTDQDDNTYTQSTVPSQENSAHSADDWFGYMEKVLFPANEEEAYVRILAQPMMMDLYPYSHFHLLIFSPMTNNLFIQKVNTQEVI